MAKKILCVITLMLALVCVFASCGHKHNWQPETCETPKTCIDCKTTEGVALGHSFESATCTTAKTCNICEKTEGQPLGHTWIEASCTTPKSCANCNSAVGEPLGHSWTAATCTTPKTCTNCKKTEGESLGHTWIDASCTTPKTCTTCTTTVGTALGHTWVNATCDTPKTCSVCNATEGKATGHSISYENGKCTACGVFDYFPGHAVNDGVDYAIWALSSIYDYIDIYNIYYVLTDDCCCDSCLNGYYAGESYLTVLIFGTFEYDGYEETRVEILGIHKKYDPTYDTHYNPDWYFWTGSYRYNGKELTEIHATDYSFYFTEEDLIWIDKNLIL